MIKVDNGIVNLSGTSEEMLMDGIMAVKAVIDTNEQLQTDEGKERYLKAIREMTYKDVEVLKFGCVRKETAKTDNSKKMTMEERRKFRNGTNSNTGRGN